MADHTTPRSKRDIEARLNSRPATVVEVRAWIVAGVATGAKNIYDQLSEESIRNFERLEEQVVRRVLADIESRSWRGKLRLRWLVVREHLRGYAIELGMVDPLTRRGDLKLELPMPSKTTDDFAPEVERALPKTD